MSAAAQSVIKIANRTQLPWLHIGWFALLLALCYGPVIGNITHQWSSDDDMGHGLFVPLIVGFIVWERGDELFTAQAASSRWGIPVMLFGTFLALFGAVSAEIFTERIALIVSTVGLILYTGGVELVRRFAFP